ncbi:EamA family transporter [Pseudoalteromonas espejiana]
MPGSQITLFRASKINLPMMVINGWSFALASLFMVPVLMFTSAEASFYQGFAIDMSDYGLLLMVALIGFSTAATQFFRGKAYRLASSNSQLAPLIYSNLLFALLFQLIFYDTTLSLSQVIGSALIVLACIINTFAPNWLLRRQVKLDKKSALKS